VGLTVCDGGAGARGNWLTAARRIMVLIGSAVETRLLLLRLLFPGGTSLGTAMSGGERARCGRGRVNGTLLFLLLPAPLLDGRSHVCAGSRKCTITPRRATGRRMLRALGPGNSIGCGRDVDGISRGSRDRRRSRRLGKGYLSYRRSRRSSRLHRALRSWEEGSSVC